MRTAAKGTRVRVRAGGGAWPLLLLLLLLLPAPAAASGPAGTLPGREPDMSMTPVGAGYFHRTVRMKPLEENFRTATFTQEQVFAEVAAERYGWGAFFRAGGATFSDEDRGGDARFDAGAKPFLATGVRYHVPLAEDGATMLVGTGRFSFTFKYEETDEKTPSDPVPGSAKVQDYWGADLTLALQRRIGPLNVFAGGAAQYYRLKVIREEAGSVRVESAFDTASNLFGALAGVRLDLGRVSVQAEVQQFQTTSFGGTLSYGF